MGKQSRELAVFIMGGTIDSRNAPEHDGEVVTLKTSLVKKYLESMHCNFDVRIHVLCMKDSRSITDQDRSDLAKAISNAGMKHNLVTHGTYTMHETAEYLEKHEELKGKVVVVTGSMGTLLGTVDDDGRLMPSDGQFNLGYAIAELFYLEYGVYQSMNGQSFSLPHEWWKHSAKGISWKKNDKIFSDSHVV